MTSDRSHRLVWVDLHTNAHDTSVGDITSIGMVVTDENLEVVAQGPEIQVDAGSLVSAEDELLAFLAEHCDRRTAPLCGDVGWKDKQTLTRCMPRVMEFLHYRIVDIATLRQLAALWYPELQIPQAASDTPHAAIASAIAELRRYRSELFIASETKE